jgi:hypothetical protein
MDTSLSFAEVHKAYLNTETWSQAFTAEIPADLQPPADPSYYTDKIVAIVLPREDEYTRITRDIAIAGDYSIDTFLASHVDFKSPQEMYDLAHEIVKRFLKQPFAIDGGHITSVSRAIWLPNHLQSKNIFGTVITVDLRTIDYDET